MRLRRLCLEVFAFRRFFNEPIEISRFPGAQCKHWKLRHATDLSFCGEVLQRLADETEVLFRFHFAKNSGDSPCDVDDESAALSAHVFSAIHALLDPDAVALHDFLFRIGKNRERQFVFIDKLSVALRRIDADAEDFGFAGKAFPGIAKAAGLRGAARRIVFRIKIDNQRRAAEIAQCNPPTFIVLGAHGDGVELRRSVAHLQFGIATTHVSKTIIRMPTAQRRIPMRTLSYFSSTPSLSLLSPASVRDVNKTIPATVAIESTAVRTAKPPQP